MKRRIALLIPHSDIVLETDLQARLPVDVVIHTHRIWLDEVGEEAEKQMVDSALPDGIGFLKGNTRYASAIFGCTSASAVYGREGLVRLENMLVREFDCPSRSAFGAVLEEIGHVAQSLGRPVDSLGIGLVTPYTQEVNAFMVKSMKMFGVNVTVSIGMGISEDRCISKVEPAEILDFIRKNMTKLISDCDAVFISCTNFRALEIREDVEGLLGLKTITSNSSIINWLTSEMVL